MTTMDRLVFAVVLGLLMNTICIRAEAAAQATTTGSVAVRGCPETVPTMALMEAQPSAVAEATILVCVSGPQ